MTEQHLVAHENSTALWHVEMFGDLRAVRLGNNIAPRVIERFQTQKTALLFALLCQNAPRSLPREQLITRLWLDAEPSIARDRLSQALSWLRRHLETECDLPPGSVIVADRMRVGLTPGAVTTDAQAFDAHIRAARAGGQNAVAEWESAVRLVSGVYLSGIGEEDDELFRENQRFAIAHEEALQNAAEGCEAAGRFALAVTYTRRLLAINPQSEETCARLLRLLSRTGERDAAIRAYDTFARRYRETNGSEPPSAALGRMVRSLRSAVSVAAERGDATGGGSDLPVLLTRYFGRETEIAELLSALEEREPVRLQTVVGVGGCGKTRLAVEVARRFAESAQESDGKLSRRAVFVPWEGITRARQIYPAVYRALQSGSGSREDGAALRSTVARLLTNTATHTLLILDNAEHLAGDTETLAVLTDLLRRVPGVSCLATSRRPLVLSGERVYALSPLPVPTDGTPEHDLRAFPCVQLFLDRMQAGRRDVSLTHQNAPTIARLCARLEGLPLAIELCAGWAATLTPEQMLTELESRFALLVNRRPDVPARHRSLYAAVQTSYALLPDDLREVFASLSVFRGGWFTDAAEAATAGGTESVRDALARLHEQSLLLADVVRDPTNGDTTTRMRFRLLDTLREFAAEQLSPEKRNVIGARHATYFLRLAETAAPFLEGVEQRTWMDTLEQEVENLRVALGFFAQRGDTQSGLRLCVALRYFWTRRGYQGEACEFFALFVGRITDGDDVPLATQAAAHNAYGRALLARGETDAARTEQETALALWESLGDRRGIARVRHQLGAIARRRGQVADAVTLMQDALKAAHEEGDDMTAASALLDLGNIALARRALKEAKESYERCLVYARRYGSVFLITSTINNLGEVARQSGDFAQAAVYYDEALRSSRLLGDRLSNILPRLNLAEIARLTGDIARAQTLIHEALRLVRPLGEAFLTAQCLFCAAVLADTERRFTRAALLFGAVTGIKRATGTAMEVADAEDAERLTASLQAALGAIRFALAVERGAAEPLDTAIAFALSPDDDFADAHG